MRRLQGRRARRGPVGRDPGRRDGCSLGRGHDGPRLLGHEGHGRDDPRAGALARVARLRRAGGGLLARVRAGRQGADHRPPAPRAPGRPVRLRREGGPRRDRGPGPPRRDHGPPAPGVGGRRTTGLPRDQPGLLRGRDHPAGRPPPPDARQGLRRGRRDSPRRGVLHPPPGVDPGLAPRAPRPAERRPGDPGPAAADAPRRAQPPLRPLPVAHLEPGHAGGARSRARLRPRARGPVGRRGGDGPGHREGVRASSPGTAASSACGPRRSRRSARPRSRRGTGSSTPASTARSRSPSGS